MLFFIYFLKASEREKNGKNQMKTDTAKELMSSPKYMSVEIINNSTRPWSNHREVNYINYK